MSLRNQINELLSVEPSGREIGKKEQLVQIYLTISTLLTALKQDREAIFMPNSTVQSAVSITQIEITQSRIQGIAFLLFPIAIIIYYMYLGEKSRFSTRIANKMAFVSAFLFSIIFVSYTNPFGGQWLHDPYFYAMCFLITYLVTMSLQVSLSIDQLNRMIEEDEREEQLNN